MLRLILGAASGYVAGIATALGAGWPQVPLLFAAVCVTAGVTLGVGGMYALLSEAARAGGPE